MGRITDATFQCEQATAERIHESFAAAVEALPLEGCSLRRDPFFDTGLEFHAPDGWAFRVTEEFEDDWATNGGYPVPSKALHDKQVARGEISQSFEDYYDPQGLQTEFIGNRLSIRVGDVQFGESLTQQQLQTARSFGIVARIATPPEYIATFGEPTRFQWEGRNGNDTWYIASTQSDIGGIGFTQQAVLAQLGDASISLIRHSFPQPEFVAVRSEHDQGLQVVETPGGISTDQYRAYLNGAGVAISEEGLLAEVRMRRLIGMPFTDDPLRHLTIMQDSDTGQAVGVIDAIHAAEAAKEDLGKDAAVYWQQRQEARRRTRILEKRREHHTTALTVIEDPQSLHEAISTHAAPGWLKRLLTKDAADLDVTF